MKKVLFYLICAASLTGCLEATTTEGQTEQTGQIWGYVSDIESGSEIANAQVELSPSNITCKTNSKGYYEFDELVSGNYKLTVRADGYGGVYRQVTINPGREFVCDFHLRENINSYAEVTPEEGLDFGRGKDVLAVTLKAHNAALAYHAELEENPAWVSLEKNDGTIPDYEKTSQVEYLKLTVDRNKMTADAATCNLIVRTGRKDFRVKVTARKNAVNDYSSATVLSCDSRVEAKIICCNRLGSVVTFNYTLTNNGLGDSTLYIDTPLTNNGGTVIYDNYGNEYTIPSMAFGTTNNGTSNIRFYSRFPEGPSCKGSIMLQNVPSNVKSITFILGVTTTPFGYGVSLESNKISFKNVPVYE